MADDETSLLRSAGLAEDAEQVYLFVLHHGRTVPDHVTARFGVSRELAVVVLEELRDLGLVARPRGTAETYAAVDPRVALTAIADTISGQATRIRERIPVLADQFERGTVAGAGSAETRVLTDPGDIASWYVRLQHQAKSELLVFDRPPYVATALEPVETSMIARGVTWRGLYTAASFEHEGAWAEATRLAELGELGRVVPELPLKLAIADGSTALVSLSLDGVRADTLVTESAPLIGLLREMFEVYWAHAIPISHAAVSEVLRPGAADTAGPEPAPPMPVRRANRPPTQEQQSILALIGAGLTDEAIATRMGMSVRSLRRRSQQLMAELGAANRFQLGVEAARRNWV